MARAATYKIYDASQQAWVEYYFVTSADLVSESASRKFISDKVYINNVPFETTGFSGAPNDAVAYIPLTLDDIPNGSTRSLANFVPYNNATANVNLGSNAISFNPSGSVQQSFIYATTKTVTLANTNTTAAKTGLLLSGYNEFVVIDGDNGSAILYVEGLTADRQFNFPDRDGTLALLETVIPLTGTASLAGSIKPSTNNAYSLGDGTHVFSNVYTRNILCDDSHSITLSADGFIEAAGDAGLKIITNGAANAILKADNITSTDKTFQFPDASGTLALTSDITAAIEALPEPMIFKGTIGTKDGTDGTYTWPNLPPANASHEGWVLKAISVNANMGVKAGDTLICANLSTTSTPDYSWVIVPSGDEPNGTVTNVGLSLPSGEFTISGSPVTNIGTLTGTWKSQNANLVFASPNGASGTPSFRALVAADIPDLSGTYIPLAGTSSLTGNIVPSTTNSLNLGASSKEFASVYARTLREVSSVHSRDNSSIIIYSDSTVELETEAGLTLSESENSTGKAHLRVADLLADRYFKFPEESAATYANPRVLATREWTDDNFTRVTVAYSNAAPSNPSTGDVWIDLGNPPS